MPYVRHSTLTANTVTPFTATGNPSELDILSRNGLGEVYVSYDGTANPPNPTIGGNDFDVIPAIAGAGIVIGEIGASDQSVVKLISAQATAVTVRGVQ